MARPRNCGKCNKPKSQCECGRPTKLNEDTIAKLESVFEIDGTIEEASAVAGINITTYHKWYKENKEFSNRIDRAKQMFLVKARHTISKGLDKGNVNAAIDVLKRRDRRYRDKLETDQTIGMSLKRKELSVEELDKIISGQQLSK